MNNPVNRRTMMQGSLVTSTAILAAARSASARPAPAPTNEHGLQLTEDWDKTFPRSEQVDHRKVTFRNRYGIALAADLYTPKDRGERRLAALAVSGPFGAVKEQSSGLYAQTMAERGYVALAFDASFTGESGGEFRNLASPDINTEDFSAAVDYLGLLPSVDREHIGVIGICGFAGMALNAAAADKRIKAVVTTSMYDMSRVMARGYYDSLTAEQRAEALENMSRQRWVDAERGFPASGPRILPETLDGVTDPVVQMYFDYYRTPRGFHPRSPNSTAAWTATSAMSFMNMPLLTYIDEIAPRPILLIAGENAHSRYFSEDANRAAADPKELVIIDGADHVDLYDRVDVIPFDRIADFFNGNLA
ncbi:alpha/beta hydrolase [Aquamicrobium sp. LC103]|uniref:alpha/beta hydrolase n=1 Tax=Aquamicrobium sp. LC103 TaxID=1120658 RepID=UPI00063E9B3A|nr:alpha/beta hydrolase [Aquamicrobium sp. LC103]TKT81287.1 alpha/beta hydrolase [Aquamicrobium sp. LC103]